MEIPMRMRSDPESKNGEKMSKNENFKTRLKRLSFEKMVNSETFWKNGGKNIFWPFLFFSTISDLEEFEEL